MDPVKVLPNGRLLVPAYVEPDPTGPSCGLATVEIGPDHPDYPRYAAQAAQPLAADGQLAERFAAREAAEARRTVALRLRSGNLLLPASQWPDGRYELGPGDPDFEAWARTAITEPEWEARWWPAETQRRRSA